MDVPQHTKNFYVRETGFNILPAALPVKLSMFQV